MKRHAHGNPTGRGPSQKWKIIYQDELPAALKKGDMNPDFGFKIDTDFYIVSAMGGRRFIDLVGTKLIIKTRIAARRDQVWYFCNKTKTVRSRRTNQAIAI